MNIGLAFWILMLLWLVLGSRPYWNRPAGQPANWSGAGGDLLLFVLLLLLGWHAFGAPLHG